MKRILAKNQTGHSPTCEASLFEPVPAQRSARGARRPCSRTEVSGALQPFPCALTQEGTATRPRSFSGQTRVLRKRTSPVPHGSPGPHAVCVHGAALEELSPPGPGASACEGKLTGDRPRGGRRQGMGYIAGRSSIPHGAGDVAATTRRSWCRCRKPPRGAGSGEEGQAGAGAGIRAFRAEPESGGGRGGGGMGPEWGSVTGERSLMGRPRGGEWWLGPSVLPLTLLTVRCGAGPSGAHGQAPPAPAVPHPKTPSPPPSFGYLLYLPPPTQAAPKTARLRTQRDRDTRHPWEGPPQSVAGTGAGAGTVTVTESSLTRAVTARRGRNRGQGRAALLRKCAAQGKVQGSGQVTPPRIPAVGNSKCPTEDSLDAAMGVCTARYVHRRVRLWLTSR